MYNELSIKSILIDHLLSSTIHEDDVVVCELPFARSKRRADMVHANGYLHAYEIKSSVDNLTRLADQIPDYEKTFDKVTVVTTKEHLKSAKIIIPKRIGLMLVENGELKIIRAATEIRRLDKNYLSYFFSKKEMISDLKENNCKLNVKHLSNAYSDDIRQIISETISTSVLRTKVLNRLKLKYGENFAVFLKFRGHVTVADDLRIISTKSTLAVCDLPA